MSIQFPILLTVAAALAGLGLWRLLRPARLRVVVSHRAVWEETLRLVGRRRAWRMPRWWVILLAAGGLALACSVSGMRWSFDRPSPQPVLVLFADTPHLAATVSGRREKDRLLARLDELFAKLAPATPVRIGPAKFMSDEFQAGQWPGHRAELEQKVSMHDPRPDPNVLERNSRRPGDAMVYLLGEFDPAPPVRPDVQWIFRPQPPADDVGIEAAGAVRNGNTGELFVRVRRFAGHRSSVKVLVDFGGVRSASQPADLSMSAAANVVLPIPENFFKLKPIEVRLNGPDDQPLNNVFYLAPRSVGGPASYELLGRPNELIDRAARTAGLTPRRENQPAADWLIVNEPADPVAAAPGQSVVLIDPVQMPASVRRIGALRDARIVSRSDEPPWNSLLLDGVKIARADRVELGVGWKAVVSDASGNPLIGYHAGERLVAIFFSVAPDNTNWPKLMSWPIFWNALRSLPGGRDSRVGGGEAGRIEWAWQGGNEPGIFTNGLAGSQAALLAENLPAEWFEFTWTDRPVDTELRKPADRPSQSVFAVWAALAGASIVLLAFGWLLASRDRREEG